MSLNDFKTLAEGIQAVVFSVAAAVGGAWALYRFRALLELTKARSEIEKLRLENESLSRTLVQRGNLNISLTATPLTHPTTGVSWMSVVASVKNVGNRPELLDWDSGHVRIALVLGFQEERPVLGASSAVKLTSIGEQAGEQISRSVVEPATNRNFCFLIPVPSPGLYLVSLNVPGSPEQSKITIEEGTRPEEIDKAKWKATWKAEVIACVTRTSTAAAPEVQAEALLTRPSQQVESDS